MKSKMINVDDEFQYPFACPGGKRGYWNWASIGLVVYLIKQRHN